MVHDLSVVESFQGHLTKSNAQAYCKNLAKTHYENFTVGSLFIPKPLRQHMANIYAFCRTSDDLGDETGSREESLRLLKDWEDQLNACYQGHTVHPVFIALEETIHEFSIPKEPFWRLIQAFKQDQIKTRYETYSEVLDYCTFSANPVGHLVLYLFGYSDKKKQELSNFTCTALQLANFWQDVARDFKIGRIYLPLEDMKRFQVNENDLEKQNATPAFKELLKFEVDRTRQLFKKGQALVDEVDGLLKIDLEAFTQGGVAVLQGIEKINYNVLWKRPVVSRFKKLKILLRAVAKMVVN